MKTHRIHVCIILLLWAATTTGNTIDSLYRMICNTNRPNIDYVNKLMICLDADGITDSLICYKKSADWNRVMASTHLYMADYFYEHQTVMTAVIQAARRAEHAARSTADTARIEEALAYQAVAAARMGQMDVALEATREELRLDSLSGDRPNLSRAYNTLAGLCLQAGRTEDASLYIRKAIEIERSLPDSSHLGVRYGLAAEIFAKTGELEQALNYARLAYAFDRKAGDGIRTARRLSQLADIHALMGDREQAERFYLRSIDSLRTNGERKSLAINLKQLGLLYAEQKRWDECRRSLTECELICRETNNFYTLQQACRLLAEVVRHTEPTRAVDYLLEALQLSDSLHSQRAEQLAAELRQSQACVLGETPEAEGTTTARSPLHILLLLAMAAVFGIVVGRRWAISRKVSAATLYDKPLEAKADASAGEARKPAVRPADIEFLARVAEIYDLHLSRQRLSIDELASEMCMSRSQFTRRLTAVTGTGANIYLNRLRLEKACRLLKDTEKPISIIAEECGFDDPSYFGSIFKKTYHATPMQYRIMPMTGKK